MVKGSGAVHVARIKSSHVDKSGRRRDYESVYLRRSYRDGKKVKHEQVANLTALPEAAIEAIEAVLAGHALVPASDAVRIARSVPHGHVAAVWAQARALGLPGLLGPAGRHRDLAMALVVARVLRPGSKLATAGWWADTTLGADLDVSTASTDEVYAAMDWLHSRQDAIEARLAARHLAEEVNPSRMALFDLSSSWMEGTHCPLTARGYSRDGKKGKAQIEYGLLTDPEGRPVAIRVFAGNTGDPTAFIDAVKIVREKFGLTKMVMVGDRGMITTARIDALRKSGELGWLTALRAPAIAKLAADQQPLQLTLFDQQDLAEIAHPDYPGERLVACRNPHLAKERARKREELLAATDTALTKTLTAVKAGRLQGADKIGLKVGKIIDTYKMAKHLDVAITDTTLEITRNTEQIAAEARLDGIYVLRTNVPAHQLDDRVRAHVLICMLAAYLTWHLRKALAPLTYTDEHPPTRDNPVAPAARSTAAERKASRHRDTNDQPIPSFRGLLDHLATLTRNDVRLTGTEHTVPILTEATSTQRRVFELLNQPLPLSLK